MAKYINADKLYERMTSMKCGVVYHNDITEELLYPEHEMLRAIKECYTADVVEVVRCKDCRYKYLENDVWCCPFGLMLIPQGFCNYGERK